MPPWLEQLHALAADGVPVVVVTVAAVRGHAPRGAGSKMLVSAEQVFGSVGGGNLEQSAVQTAREMLAVMLAGGAAEPRTLSLTLNPKGGDHGVQCCGGEVTLLLEPVHSRRPTLAIFGAGHVGRALAQVLALLPIHLVMVDSRRRELDALPALAGPAELRVVHAPVPEAALAELPAGAHLVVMTHDHAEDIAVLDTALRRADLGFVGLIGSSAKWAHFRTELAKAGHDEAALARVTTPIGLPGVPGKSPQAVAIATAAQLLGVLELPEGGF